MAVEKRDIEDIPVRILVINGSNRKQSNSSILQERAVKQLQKMKNVEIDTVAIYNKVYGREDKKKDFQEFLEKWNQADGILLLLPNYTVGGPGSIYSAFERLTESLAEDIQQGVYKKVAGVLVQGSHTYGMPEVALESTFDILATLHVWPVYRLPATIRDKEAPEKSLLEQVDKMTKETVEGARILKHAQGLKPEKKAEILVVNIGMDDPEIGEKISQRVKERLEKKPNVGVKVLSYSGEKLIDCHHCNQLCGKTFRCAFQDAFQDFFDYWLPADGVIWVTSSNQAGPAAEAHYLHDRLSETGFSAVSDRSKKLGVPYLFCKYTKAEAAISYGKYSYSGQTLAQQFFVNVAQQRGNFYITGRTPGSLGPAVLLRQPTQLGCEQRFTADVDHLVDDVAKIAQRIETAKASLYDSLSEYYYNSTERMGIPAKEEYFNE